MDGTLSLSDLKDALKDTLEARGSMGQIRARIRAEIFQALDEGAPKAKLSNENLIINELIREYMEYNGYRHALSVFVPESGQPVEKPFHRRFLAHELNITEDPRYTQVPLLYSILTALQDSKHPTEEQHQPPRPPLRTRSFSHLTNSHSIVRTVDRNDDDAQSEHSLVGLPLDPSTPRPSHLSVNRVPSPLNHHLPSQPPQHPSPGPPQPLDRQPPSNPLVVISN
ncbi:hypothetical protein H257_06097 [Aphanomyces astaci]|uniref:Centrosomal protein 20 n=1 Tax=Aphanomyces astaci TaxID=112090 RepID=W4GLP1_APHAT|nr:hypothetical protein H257_06097 [Aphanomyces astaci]ETV80567.1 hypothetical protein H257_06097 [Aphanomyces astaci]|eukprot:XP_009829514.1 hypothetical protein H257_06097 [Aphanomyces astaci]